MNLLLKNLKWKRDENLFTGDILIEGKKIVDVGDQLLPRPADKVLRFNNHFAYCGLTNAHDHLEMNLYPRLGTPPYANYTAWAKEIYKPAETPVREIENIPIRYRLLWGGLKNLISGVTTVVHHNPWHYSLNGRFPVRVLRKYAWAHSLAFEKNPSRKFPWKRSTPFIIHAAEGIDSMARNEIGKLKEAGLLKPNSVLIHVVAAGTDEIELIAEARSAVVWCPSSNYFLFGKSAEISQLKKRTPIALGTDSVMTGPATLLQEMQTAHQSNEATPGEIFDMVTSAPQKIFNLPEQRIWPGFPADLVVTPIKAPDYFESLVLHKSQEISCVMVNGEINYADEMLAKELSLKGFMQKVNNVQKWLAIDIAKLKTAILSSGIDEKLFDNNHVWTSLAE